MAKAMKRKGREVKKKKGPKGTGKGGKATGPRHPALATGMEGLEKLASKMLDRGHQIINRAVQSCQEHKAFESALKASVSKHGELRTTEEVADALNVSPWHVGAIMRRTGAKKILVAGIDKSLTRTFWRLKDCHRAEALRKPN